MKVVDYVCATKQKPCIEDERRKTNLYIVGDIGEGDYQKFVKTLRDYRIHSVYLRSRGGNVFESLLIGSLIRELLLSTHAPMYDDRHKTGYCPESVELNGGSCVCASACALIYLGGVPRNLGKIYFHRPYIDPTQNARLSLEESRDGQQKIVTSVRSYLRSMEIPDWFVEKILATDSKSLFALTEKEAIQFLVGYPSHLEEWLMAKCSIISEKEYQTRYFDLFEKTPKENLDAKINEFNNLVRNPRDYCITDSLGDQRYDSKSKRGFRVRTVQ